MLIVIRKKVLAAATKSFKKQFHCAFKARYLGSTFIHTRIHDTNVNGIAFENNSHQSRIFREEMRKKKERLKTNSIM